MIKASLSRLHAALLVVGASTSEADDVIACALEAGADDEDLMSATRSIMRVVEAPRHHAGRILAGRRPRSP